MISMAMLMGGYILLYVFYSANLAYHLPMHSLYRSHAEETKPGSCDIFQRYIDSTDSMAMPHFDQTTWTHETKIYWLKVPTNVDPPGR